MASVYRALDVRLNRHVAVKVILASFRSDSDYATRFEREAQAIAQLEHLHIITIYRYGELDSILYMAMQYVDGADLADVIESYHRDGVFIDFDDVIKLAHEIGQALDYAHSKGVIHRDIKPHNILIHKDGRSIVSDFGLALLTEVGTRGEIFGSPRYIAPEQAISSAGVVPQSDLYALAVMLFEMLTGSVPFDGDEPLDIAMKHMSDAPPSPRTLRPELSQDVEDVLLKALAKQPEDRYPSGKDLAIALEKALKLSTMPTQKSKSKFTIPQRVIIEAEAKPLPSLDDLMPQKTQKPNPKTAQRKKKQQKQKSSNSKKEAQKTVTKPAIILGGIVILALIAILFFFSMMNNNNPSNTLVVDTPQDNTPTLNPSATPEPIATQTEVVIVVQATNTITNTPTIQAWTLEISWVDDSVFIVNTSTIGFPLQTLELTGNGSVLGTEWGLATLEPNQCVAVFSDATSPEYANMACELVGNTSLARSSALQFWRASFAVKYNGRRLEDTCITSPCLVEIQ